MSVDQLFDDQAFHLSVVMLAPDGTSRRLACSPALGPIHPLIEERPVVAPDAVYIIASGEPTQIVRIPP